MILSVYCDLYIDWRGVEQLVARRAHNPKVAGSSPALATIHLFQTTPLCLNI